MSSSFESPYEKRKSFRIHYTEDQRPVLRIGNQQWIVLESTKHTLRIIEAESERLSMIDDHQGTLHHPDGTVYSVSGQVKRREENETVLEVEQKLHTGTINRRDLFRILYPPIDRIPVIIDGITHEVTEISEGGFRYLRKEDSFQEVGSIITAEIHLRDGENVSIQGELIREEAEESVVQLIQGIPLEKVMAEQKYLLQKYRD
ncbi:MAG: hypothetical protein QF752_11680 [Planctomycetota bacterium]|jgi:hypothetical protein|nr:hypothetical protein [Planctomycetota bacterium]